MKVAIIGAGLSGLAVSSFLLLNDDSIDITLFDLEGIAGGASKVASGLLHSNPGEKGRLSLEAPAAMRDALELIELAKKFIEKPFFSKGVIRYALNEDQAKAFEKQGWPYLQYPCFEIKEAYTIDIPLYLQGLWQFCQSRGAKLILEKVMDTKNLEEFDQIVIAAGSGVSELEEGKKEPLKYIKGQVLLAKKPQEISRSTIGKGYVALSPTEPMIHLGSTYEHRFSDANPCMKTAKEIIIPRLRMFLPWVESVSIESCQSAIRVANRHHYFPIAKKIDQKRWLLTGLGSRGLLYHAFLGKRIVAEML